MGLAHVQMATSGRERIRKVSSKSDMRIGRRRSLLVMIGPSYRVDGV